MLIQNAGDFCCLAFVWRLLFNCCCCCCRFCSRFLLLLLLLLSFSLLWRLLFLLLFLSLLLLLFFLLLQSFFFSLRFWDNSFHITFFCRFRLFLFLYNDVNAFKNRFKYELTFLLWLLWHVAQSARLFAVFGNVRYSALVIFASWLDWIAKCWRPRISAF